MTLFTWSLPCVKWPVEGSRFNNLKFYKNHKSYVNECLHYFACFSKLLSVKKLMVVLWKDRKPHLLSNFLGQDVSKNGHSKIMFTSQFTTIQKVTWKAIVFLKPWLVITKFKFTFTFTLLHITVHFFEFSEKFFKLMSLYLLRKGAYKTFLDLNIPLSQISRDQQKEVWVLWA